MNWYLKCLSNYVTFSGRARRKEYWMFVLFNIIFAIAASIIDMLISVAADESLRIVSALYSLAIILPSWAVSIRRLHDINRSGWFMLLGFIPFVGGIILLVFNCMDGTPRLNKYGPDPKGRNNGGYNGGGYNGGGYNGGYTGGYTGGYNGGGNNGDGYSFG